MGMKWLFRHQDLQIANISNLIPLEVVGRGSETQLQAG